MARKCSGWPPPSSAASPISSVRTTLGCDHALAVARLAHEAGDGGLVLAQLSRSTLSATSPCVGCSARYTADVPPSPTIPRMA
jgi:hypothetical protein